MRLIDADKIDFGKVFIGASGFAKDTREAAQKLIDAQPTVYDVDKVVEQLEDCIADTTDTPTGLGASWAYKGAIEIVKAGGVNE